MQTRLTLSEEVDSVRLVWRRGRSKASWRLALLSDRCVCRMEGSQHRGWSPGRCGCGKEEFPILGEWSQASLWVSGLRDTLIETTGLTGTGVSLEERSSVWFEPMGGKGDISSSCLGLTASFLIIGNPGRKDSDALSASHLPTLGSTGRIQKEYQGDNGSQQSGIPSSRLAWGP